MSRPRTPAALLILSVLALAGCGDAAVASVEPLQTSEASAVVPTPIPTRRPTPSPTPVPTPRPSLTPAPTLVVSSAEGEAARAGFAAFAAADGTPFHLVLASKVDVRGEAVTLRLTLDIAGNGDIAGKVAAKAGDETETAEVVIVGGRQFVRASGRAWTEVAGEPTTSNPLGAVPLDKVAWVGMDTIKSKPLHHLRIEDPAVVGASNVGDQGITDLEIKSGVMDFWVNANGTPVLARFRIAGSGVARGLRADFSIVGRYDFSDIGKPVTIQAPIN
jgi:hypothetical protein